MRGYGQNAERHLMQDSTSRIKKIGGTLSVSVALLGVVFLVLTFACFLMVTVWLSVQQHTLRFERKVSEVSVAAVRMFHASNAYQGPTLQHADGSLVHSDEDTVLHADLVETIRIFTENSEQLKLLFHTSEEPPAWNDIIGQLIWLSGATKIPDDVREIWNSASLAPAMTIAEMLRELERTCLYLCEAPNVSRENRDLALAHLNRLTVNKLQPQLGEMLAATGRWQARNITVTRYVIAIAFFTLVT